MKTVSILIPVYNSEKFLKRCLESVIKQTYKNITIIVLNDGSTDSSEKIIDYYLKKDSRIIKYNQKNKGLAFARNKLIELCDSDYFFYLDSDDYLELDAIKIYLKCALKNNADIVASNFYLNKGNKRKIWYINNKVREGMSKEEYLKVFLTFAWINLYKTSFVKNNNFKFNDKYDFFEDVGCLQYWIYKCKKLYVMDIPLYNYVINKNSLVRNNNKSEERIKNAILQIENLLKKFKNEDFIKLPKYINDPITLHFSNVMIYIQFHFKGKKSELKKELKILEKKYWKLKMPSLYWRYWYFVLYKLLSFGVRT